MSEYLFSQPRARQIRQAVIANSGTLNIVTLDFDGTLRDGLKEKTFVFDLASQATHRLFGIAAFRPYTIEDMRRYAGRPVDVIGIDHWPETIGILRSTDGTAEDFGRLYKQAFTDIYTVLKIETRGAALENIRTVFTDEERRRIVAEMPAAPWFPGIQDDPNAVGLIQRLSDIGAFTAVLSNTNTYRDLTDEIDTGVFRKGFDCVHTGAPLGQGKPKAGALLHIFALAAAEVFVPEKANSLLQSLDNKSSDEHDRLAEEILETVKNSDLKVRLLMVGDGDTDIKTAQNAARELTAKGFSPSQVAIETLALGYGFQSLEYMAAALSKEGFASPDYAVENDPNLMTQFVKQWAHGRLPMNTRLQIRLDGYRFSNVVGEGPHLGG